MATAKMSADLTSHDAISSTNASSTTLRNAKLTAHPPIGGVKLPTTLPVSESSSRAVTWTTEAESQDVLAHASSSDRVMSRHRSVLDAGKIVVNLKLSTLFFQGIFRFTS